MGEPRKKREKEKGEGAEEVAERVGSGGGGSEEGGWGWRRGEEMVEEAEGTGNMPRCGMGGEGEKTKSTGGGAATKEGGGDTRAKSGGEGGKVGSDSGWGREAREFRVKEKGGKGIGGGVKTKTKGGKGEAGDGGGTLGGDGMTGGPPG